MPERMDSWNYFIRAAV